MTVLRGTGTDRFGDEVDTDTVVYTQRPASIIEQQPNSRSRPAEGRTDQVRGYALRMHSNTRLLKGDRIRDERTGDTYTVDFLATPANPAGHTSRRATLRKVT
ncbi:MAG TPA: hypothetical protein VF516_00185 [Kofleriaceae bacterium]